MKTVIGHYAIISELGRGGMGVVYKAFEPKLDRYVAIKELSSALSHDEALVQRFIREAQAMAALNDPNIIQIHYIGHDDEQPFFAMEFVDGESLDSLLQREGKLSVKDSLKLLQQAAKGLATAHEHGVIHRDIKPSNLMLNKRDQLKIADFGIAQTQRDAANKKLTATGDVVGTPGYLSPEVCLGNPVDSRSDLFALGIVLFEMLSGRLPFENASPLKLMLSVVESDVPDIRTINEDVDNDTVLLLNRLLAKQPDHRYQSANELLSDLNQHPALQSDTPLSVRARLPSGAASTLLATPGLAKPAPKPTLATPAGASPNAQLAQANGDTLVIKKRSLLLVFGLIALTGLAAFWWLKSNRETTPPAIAETNNPSDAAASNEKPITPVTTMPPAAIEPTAPTIDDPAKTVKPVAPVITETPKNVTKTETKPAIVKPELTKPEVVKPTAEKKAAVDEPMEKYGSVYIGSKNEEVSIAHVQGKDIAYVKVTGINSDYDGKVIRMKFRPAAYQGRDYFFKHNGGDYVMVVMRKNTYDSGMRTSLYIPGLDYLGEVVFSSEQSKQLDTKQFRAEFKDDK